MVDVEYGPQPAPHSREPGRTGHELEVLLGCTYKKVPMEC